MSKYTDVFDYNPESGELRWTERPLSHFSNPFHQSTFNKRQAGKVAGAVHCTNGKPTGFSVMLNRKRMSVHRLIWEMHNGTIPIGMYVDHINCNPLDNRLCNLRLATPSQNCMNRKNRTSNQYGIKGVHYAKLTKKWCAYIDKDGERISLGSHITKGLAAVARAKAAIRYHQSFARI